MVRVVSAWLVAVCFLFSFSVSPAGAAPPKYRTWTDASGEFKIEAEFVDVDGDKVKLKKKADGKTLTLPLDKLSSVDRGIARKMKADRDGPAKKKSDNPFEDAEEDAEEEDYDDEDTGGRQAAAGSKGNFKKVTVRLDRAKTVRPVAIDTTWSIEPDPAPLTQLPFRPKALAFSFGKREFGTFSEETDYFFCNDDPSRVLTAVHLSKSSQHNSIVFVGDLKTGRTVSVSFPFRLTPFGLSPNGESALFLQEPADSRGSGKSRNLAIADASDPKLPCRIVCAPFAQDASERRSDFAGDVKWATWADDENVLALSAQGRLILFNPNTGRVRWTSASGVFGGFHQPVLSPNRKYMVVEVGNRSAYLMETATGESIGRLEVGGGDDDAGDQGDEDGNVSVKIDTSGWSSYAFSPDGTKLARVTGDYVTIWNVTNGKAEEPFYIRSSHPLTGAWLDDRFLLDGGTLVETDQRVPVWKYQGVGGKDRVFGGFFWHSGKEDNDYVLVPLRLPHSGIPKLKTLTEEQKYRIRPGIAVKLHIDSAIPDNGKVREHVLKMIEANELVLQDDAPITLAVKIKAEAPEKAVYAHSRFGAPPPMFMRGGGTEVTLNRYTMSYSFEVDGKPLWERSSRTSSPSVSTDEIAHRSLQDVINEKSKPTSDWYLEVIIPKKIPNERIGSSWVTLNGVR